MWRVTGRCWKELDNFMAIDKKEESNLWDEDAWIDIACEQKSLNYKKEGMKNDEMEYERVECNF